MNGIIIDGKVYEAVEKENGNPCLDCALSDMCGIIAIDDLCITLGKRIYFRYSQSLTDKLNK